MNTRYDLDLDEVLETGSDPDCPLTIREIAEEYPLAESTLSQAVREGRLEATRIGGTEKRAGLYLVTRRAVDLAIKTGNLRPRK